ncbi:MAG: hypothetical protein ABIN48_02600 [Ginsengibacter sp.]
MEQPKNKPTPNELSKEIDSREDNQKMKQETIKKNIQKGDNFFEEENIASFPDDQMDETAQSSANEEGNALFDNALDQDIRNDSETNVSPQEREDLRKAANDMPGDEGLREAALDSTDEDGTPLNEGSFDRNISPSDLDVPGAGLDDAREKTGSEDEENNEYSLGGDNHPNN